VSAIKENPILFGCLGILALISLMVCGGMAFVYLMADEIVEKGLEVVQEGANKMGEEAGLKDPITTLPELMAKGWGLSINVEAGSDTVEFTLEPMEPRVVDCAVLQDALFPYLTGTMETVVVTSTSSVVSQDGTISRTPVECRWSGYPGSGGKLDAPIAADDDDSAQ